MNEISLPYHLIIPVIISLLVLGLIIKKSKKLFKSAKWKWYWVSFTLFLVTYTILVGSAAYRDISSQLYLQTFDLNDDGFFTINEITPEQQQARKMVITDNGRNFAFITGAVFAAILSMVTLIIGKVLEFIRKKKNYTQQRV